MSFGDYRVAEADTRSMATRKSSEPDSFWVGVMFEIFGLSASSSLDDDDGERMTVSTSHTYQFRIGDGVSWDAECHFLAERRQVKEFNNALITNQRERVSVKTVSSHYKCRYTAPDREPWVLTVERGRGQSRTMIRMTNDDEQFEAYSTAGEYVAADGREVWGQPADPGYTWTREKQNVAAVSVRGKPPQVWLHKENHKATNDVLAMGSAGLYIYHLEIVPTLEKG